MKHLQLKNIALSFHQPYETNTALFEWLVKLKSNIKLKILVAILMSIKVIPNSAINE